jgi:hypothetical protein
MNTVSHVPIKQASIIAALVAIVGGVVSVVPDIQPYQAQIVATLTAVVVAAGLIANCVHALAASRLSVGSVEDQVEAAVKVELRKLLGQAISTTPVAATSGYMQVSQGPWSGPGPSASGNTVVTPTPPIVPSGSATVAPPQNT